ncbi:MAG TPA: class I SAM-dependent methyltransferase family protein, partial [Tepidisphaeraceae bacterium]
YIPCALPALRLRMKFGGRPFIKSYVKGTMLTHDAAQAEAYARDPLVSRQIAVNILLGLQDAATRLLADAGAIRTPTLLLSAGSDWVVKNSAQKKFFNRLSSAIKQHVEYPGFYHSIFHEAGRAKPIAEVKRFIEGVFDTAPQSNPLLRADREGYTKREYDGLCRPLPIYSPKRLALAAQKVYLKTLGRLSAGIRLGWRRGFDSGQSLDYIYENRARGITAIGRLTDRIYLNTVGWRGIRQRKINLQNALRNAIARVREAGQVPRILDIAGGPGRYILDALKDLAGGSALALIRDQNTAALDAGRTLAAQMDLKNVTFAPGDAFDEQNLASLRPRFNIAIVSGLYELFPDNDPVLRSLRGLASAVERGGYLLYTNQPWHPQVEMIARVLTNREQKPWIMRRRTQAEMDELVRSAGFEKLSMAIDEDGIFTVSTARRAAP